MSEQSDFAVDPYYTEFAAEYDRHTKGVQGDIDLYRTLALEANGLVVELGVGTGRIAIPAAEAGVDLLGLDRSPEMLAICRVKAEAAGVRRLSLAVADMRRFALMRPAALVTIPHRAFLHNLTTADQRATLASCRAALALGGRLAINIFDPDIVRIAHRIGRGAEEWEAGVSGEQQDAQRQQYDTAGQRADSTIVLTDATGRSRRVAIRLRYVHRFEMEHLLIRSGFEVERLEGDCFRQPYGPSSTEMVWVARAV